MPKGHGSFIHLLRSVRRVYLQLVIGRPVDYNKGVDTKQIRNFSDKGDDNMLLVTTETVSGRELETLGLVKGSTIQSKNIGRDITQSFKTLVGGELKSYTDMMNEARCVATQRMIDEAQALGADAVVAVRYSSASVMQGAAEVMAYGTAVKFK